MIKSKIFYNTITDYEDVFNYNLMLEDIEQEINEFCLNKKIVNVSFEVKPFEKTETKWHLDENRKFEEVDTDYQYGIFAFVTYEE